MFCYSLIVDKAGGDIFCSIAFFWFRLFFFGLGFFCLGSYGVSWTLSPASKEPGFNRPPGHSQNLWFYITSKSRLHQKLLLFFLLILQLPVHQLPVSSIFFLPNLLACRKRFEVPGPSNLEISPPSISTHEKPAAFSLCSILCIPPKPRESAAK